MKLPTVVLAGSLVANLALFAAFSVRPLLAPAPIRSFFENVETPATLASASTSTPAARAKVADRGATWATLQTEDLKTLVQRLRAAGFPASIIRAVISAEIQQRFAPRLKALNTSELATEYWKGDSFTSLNTRLYEERNSLMRERARLLRDILGDQFFATDSEGPSATYGNLPRAKISLIERINDDYSEMTADVRKATRGITLPEDQAKFALLEREKRADIAAILTPEELADYEMRTSRITSRLKSALTLMDASEQEFKAIYGIQQKYAAQLYPEPEGATSFTYTSAMSEARQAAEASVQAEIVAALGEQRAAEYERSTNYEYQRLARLAKQQNLPSDAAARAFDLRSSTAAESVRISQDKSLSTDQKRAALQSLAQSTRAQLVNTLGPTAGEQYAKSATWLQAIERGSSVRFTGSSTTYTSTVR